jgi:O-antigen ligase
MGALPLALREEFPQFGFDYQPAHFVLLDAAAETGILGAFFYGALLVTPWALLFLRRGGLTPELIGLSGALLALTLVGFFDYYTWSRASGQVWAWVVLGLWVGAYSRSARTEAGA